MSKQAQEKILAIGASGTVGSGIVRILKKQGHAVVAATSKKAVDPDQVFVNVVTGEGLRAAFEGVDRAFFLSPPGHADMYGILAPLIQEAKRRALKKVVLMTAFGANASDETPFRRAELDLERSGLAFNVIRPNWFFQNFNTYWIQGIREQAKILVPAGPAKASFIDTRDISAVAAKLLVDDTLSNSAFDLTGPESVDHAEVAQAISKATTKTVTYESIPADTLKQGLLSAGFAKDYVEFFMLITGFLREGYNAPVTGAVREILGRDPISLAQYASDSKKAWL
jgi:uncharacterized protein YbjT (DUF2867 family)